MKDKTRNILAIVLIVAMIAVSVIGFTATEEGSVVLAKASKICLECIGIG